MRFQLRSLLLLVTFLATYVGMLVARPVSVGVFGLLVLSAISLPVIVAGIVYSRGVEQAFWIGCAVGAAPMAFMLLTTLRTFGWVESTFDFIDNSEGGFRVMLAINHVYIVLCGLVIVGVRWLCLRSVQR